MSLLQPTLDTRVCVITCDGRNIFGILRGYDNSMNIILDDALERIFSIDQKPIINPIGTYLIRGDNLVLLGSIDEDKDALMNLDSIRAQPLKPVTHH